MSEGSRPDFEPPDQRLDGTNRTPEEPAAEPPEPAAQPPGPAAQAEQTAQTAQTIQNAKFRWPRTARRNWLVAAAGALAVVAAGGGAWALNGGGNESGTPRFTSMPEPCSLVPGTTLERHVPDSGPPVPTKNRTGETERYAACEWTEPPMGARTFTVHQLNIAVRLHLDGVAQAKAEYHAAWLGARSMAGTSQRAGGSQHAEAPGNVKIGEQAFTGYSTLSGPLGRSGTATTTVRLRNAVITVRFQETATGSGADASPRAGASKAPDEEAARAGAEAIAKSATDTLAGCAECLGR